MKKIQLGQAEVVALMIVMIGAKGFLGYPRLVTDWGLTAGWLVVFLSGLLSIFFWLLIAGVLARLPGKPLTKISELAFGPAFGLLINLLYFLYFLIATGINLRLFSDVSIITVLTETPANIIALVFILAAWLAAYYGIEAIFRSAYFVFSIISIVVIIVLLLLYPFYDLKMLQPLTGPGVFPVLKSSIMGISAFAEIIILTFFVRFFSFDTQKLKNVGVFSISYIMFFFIAIVAVNQMVFLYPTSSEVLVPFYQLSRTIFLGHYLQRVEAVFVIFWAFTAFLRIAAGLLVSAIVLQDTFKLPYYRPLLPVLSLLIFTIAFTPVDLFEMIKFEGEVRMVYGGFFVFGLSLIIGVVALILRKGDGQANDSQN